MRVMGGGWRSWRGSRLHVFAVNPYGRKPDQKSHLEGRVSNVDEVVSRSSPHFHVVC